MENTSNNAIKIGYTSGKVEKRMKQLLTGSSDDLAVIKTIPTDFGYKLERYLHRVFAHKKVRGEWFMLSKEDIDEVDGLCEKNENNIRFLIEQENYFMKCV